MRIRIFTYVKWVWHTYNFFESMLWHLRSLKISATMLQNIFEGWTIPKCYPTKEIFSQPLWWISCMIWSGLEYWWFFLKVCCTYLRSLKVSATMPQNIFFTWVTLSNIWFKHRGGHFVLSWSIVADILHGLKHFKAFISSFHIHFISFIALMLI